MPLKIPLLPRLYFSYSQFLVYDSIIKTPGCLWTSAHYAQGFARRESTACFATLLEFGYADISISTERFHRNEGYERIVALPFLVSTGKLVVDGPEEHNIGRTFELPAGNYRIVAAQRVIRDDEELIDLFFEALQEPIVKSEVIVADMMLDPPIQLVETADIA